VNFDKHILSPSSLTGKKIALQKFLNQIFNRVGVKIRVSPLLDSSSDMVSDFQRMNFYHLLNRVIQNRIEGDLVELGCFEGQTALVFQEIIQKNRWNGNVYLFDNFKHDFGLKTDVREKLIANFQKENYPLPNIIAGDFNETVPSQLPSKIAFLHIDCGFGGDPHEHKKVILHCLNYTYSRMPAGAIGVMMDYHVEGTTIGGLNCNKGVTMACNEFFADKPEKVYTLYGGQYSHGYFVKGWKDQNQS
jgi:O-methyltransferase